MNKTYPINISGIVFYIDEDAFLILEDYLNSLKEHYLKTEDGAEIISDIESRIAELFSQKISTSKQIISKSEVEEVINKLGKVEDFEEDSNSSTKTENKTKDHTFKRSHRKFYRDADDGIVAGVTSGLAHYFGIDVVFVRILFLLLIIGGTVGFWIYIVLWIVSPYARTTAEKLEMKGEPVNLSNMEKKIREEFENVKASFKDQNTSQKIKSFANGLANLITQIILGVLSILKSIFGFSFLLIGVILLSLIASFFIFDSSIISITNEHWVSLPIDEILVHFTNEKQSNILLLSLAGIIIIPIISLIYSGIRLLLAYKTKNKSFGVISFILLLFASIILALSIADIAGEFKVRKTISKTIDIEPNGDIFLQVNDNSLGIDPDKISFSDDENEFIITKTGLFIKVENEIYESTDSLFHLKIKKSSNGKNKQQAKVYLENIDYNIEFRNDTLFLDYYLTIDDKFRAQEIEIQIFKPKGTKINTNMSEFIDNGYYDDFFEEAND